MNVPGRLLLVAGFSAFLQMSLCASLCQVPEDLKVRYNSLVSVRHRFRFLRVIPYGNTVEVGARGAVSSHTFGNTDCPFSLASGSIRERSSCPWYLNITHDPTRFPVIIQQAVCRCTRECIGRNARFTCMPVQHTIHVFRQTGDCADGLLVYELRTEYQTSACICVRKRKSLMRERKKPDRGSIF